VTGMNTSLPKIHANVHGKGFWGMDIDYGSATSPRVPRGGRYRKRSEGLKHDG
jgi:hypothetical protein